MISYLEFSLMSILYSYKHTDEGYPSDELTWAVEQNISGIATQEEIETVLDTAISMGWMEFKLYNGMTVIRLSKQGLEAFEKGAKRWILA